MPQRMLVVQGTDRSSGDDTIYCAGGKFSPFAVFDMGTNTCVRDDLRWKLVAVFLCWWHAAREK